MIILLHVLSYLSCHILRRRPELWTLTRTMQAFWAIPFMDPNSKAPTPSGFIASFVTVPLLTYTLSTVIVMYFWTRSSRRLEVPSWELADTAWRSVPLVVGRLTKKANVTYQYLLDTLVRRRHCPEPTMV